MRGTADSVAIWKADREGAKVRRFVGVLQSSCGWAEIKEKEEVRCVLGALPLDRILWRPGIPSLCGAIPSSNDEPLHILLISLARLCQGAMFDGKVLYEPRTSSPVAVQIALLSLARTMPAIRIHALVIDTDA